MNAWFGKKALWAGLAVAGVVVLAGFKPFGMGGFHGHGEDPAKMAKFITWRVNDALDDLDATDAQRTQVLAVKDRLVAEGLALHGQSQPRHQEALRLWEQENPDPAQVHALVDARVEELRKLAHSAADGALQVHRTLTPEQRAKVAAKMQERMAEP